MSSNSADKILMPSIEELLGLGSAIDKPILPEFDKVTIMPLSLIHDFKDHPFRVPDDAKMAEMVDSIKLHGVLVPGIVRPDPDGGYEAVAGHRRRRGAALAGLTEMPVIIKNLTDDEATVIMVDSNIQREDILPSEKAWAYRMKYEALKRMGKDNLHGGRNDQVLAEQSGESRNTIQRYIRLTYLIKPFLDMVDEGKMGKNVASDYLSYLKDFEQEWLLNVINKTGHVPNGEQGARLKEFSQNGRLTESIMELVLAGEEPTEKKKISFSSKALRKYFPPEYSAEQMEETIYKLLQEWKEKQG